MIHRRSRARSSVGCSSSGIVFPSLAGARRLIAAVSRLVHSRPDVQVAVLSSASPFPLLGMHPPWSRPISTARALGFEIESGAATRHAVCEVIGPTIRKDGRERLVATRATARQGPRKGMLVNAMRDNCCAEDGAATGQATPWMLQIRLAGVEGNATSTRKGRTHGSDGEGRDSRDARLSLVVAGRPLDAQGFWKSEPSTSSTSKTMYTQSSVQNRAHPNLHHHPR